MAVQHQFGCRKISTCLESQVAELNTIPCILVSGFSFLVDGQGILTSIDIDSIPNNTAHGAGAAIGL